MFADASTDWVGLATLVAAACTGVAVIISSIVGAILQILNAAENRRIAREVAAKVEEVKQSEERNKAALAAKVDDVKATLEQTTKVKLAAIADVKEAVLKHAGGAQTEEG
jgi:hypothetical protein